MIHIPIRGIRYDSTEKVVDDEAAVPSLSVGARADSALGEASEMYWGVLTIHDDASDSVSRSEIYDATALYSAVLQLLVPGVAGTDIRYDAAGRIYAP